MLAYARSVGGSSAQYAQWVEGSDQILGEYRGSATIERYIDPGATLPDFAVNTTTLDDQLAPAIAIDGSGLTITSPPVGAT